MEVPLYKGRVKRLSFSSSLFCFFPRCVCSVWDALPGSTASVLSWVLPVSTAAVRKCSNSSSSFSRNSNSISSSNTRMKTMMMMISCCLFPRQFGAALPERSGPLVSDWMFVAGRPAGLLPHLSGCGCCAQDQRRPLVLGRMRCCNLENLSLPSEKSIESIKRPVLKKL